MALSNFASQIDRSEIKMMMLPGDFNSPNESVSYWLPNQQNINQLMTKHFNLPSEQDEGAIANNQYASLEGIPDISNPRLRISVQDSTENQEVLQSALDTLREAGYTRVNASKNWQDPLAKTRVIAQSGDDEAAEEVRSILGVGEVVVESTGELNSDITVQLGRDWKKQLQQLIKSNLRSQELESAENFSN